MIGNLFHVITCLLNVFQMLLTGQEDSRILVGG